MKRSIFWGCKIPEFLPDYRTSTLAVLKRLGLPVVEMEYGCCGYPVRHRDRFAFLVSAARNFALAARAGVEIITPCKCCFGTLKAAAMMLEAEPDLTLEAARLLAAEGLDFRGPVPVRHLLQLIRDEIGPEQLEERTVRSLDGLPVALSYGCHALRPSRVTDFDDPLDPKIFETVLAAAGVKPVDWAGRLGCCGNPLAERNPELSARLTEAKRMAAAQAGAEAICLACTYCRIQFDSVPDPAGSDTLPPVLFTQLLGLSLGLEPEDLGLDPNSTGGRLLTGRMIDRIPAD